ncbi:uncharacterized protein BCR38DRAFT_418943 [Pseudomassariella vexata]|uniref:EGF domain-specific O-linked N-acetylglucosamine transferase n=1 Tax=Pseudomassariella vexata TaxID=1141098 RepID=A0A1Y2ELE0_9PEZI|nr:uncharacterized protein BCR38DRAFT_418943 [Pseudomassariella vexata]ORY72114.1 hypothetical protein BCR38DRAFT_418943 [Pseudomassariella vexata]
MMHRRRRAITILLSLLILFLVIGGVTNVWSTQSTGSIWPTWSLASDKSGPLDGCHNNTSTLIPLQPLKAPADYQDTVTNPLSCPGRLGIPYLEELRQSRAAYCSSESPSQLTCFHSQKAGGGIDSFCVGQPAVLGMKAKFQLFCDEVEPYTIETNETSRKLDNFQPYWYETGPRIIFDRFIRLENKELAPSTLTAKNSSGFSILLKREGPDNLWHSLMEIMALSITLDVLQITRKQHSADAILSPEDAANTQVVLLEDEHSKEGPYFDLWRLFAQRPTVRLAEVPAGADMGTLIIPLPGASNPVWQDDWEPNNCAHSQLLRTFSKRVQRHVGISDEADADNKDGDKIVVTFIDRKGSRKLVDQDNLMAALEKRYINAPVRLELNIVDMAAIPFAQQVQMVRDSDVLAGVHGAGLTHALWLREPSAVVEILPKGFMHKGFRNLAGALGNDYFSTHGSIVPTDGRGDGKGPSRRADWQTENVALDEARFVELMEVAIKSRYNTGQHNFDIN